MSELRKYSKRLLEFAKRNNFQKPFSEIYFTEEQFIKRSYDSEKPDEIFRQNIFTFENYENRFDEIFNQGYSWINMNFAGMLDNNFLVVIELPKYKNNAEYTSVNLSLPDRKVIENNWDTSPLLKFI